MRLQIQYNFYVMYKNEFCEKVTTYAMVGYKVGFLFYVVMSNVRCDVSEVNLRICHKRKCEGKCLQFQNTVQETIFILWDMMLTMI